MGSGNRNSKEFFFTTFKKLMPVAVTIIVVIILRELLISLVGEEDIALGLTIEICILLFVMYAAIVIMDIRRNENLKKKYNRLEYKYQKKVDETAQTRRDIMEYFLLWVHQIKTPIAAAKLIMKTVDNPFLKSQIISIEKYTEMAISYLKLSSGDAEIYIEQINLDRVIKEILKKYAVLFIAYDIELDYKPFNVTVTSDSKWLSIALEQIVSNATKYAVGTKVIFSFDKEKNSLIIKDEGIGIKSEDLPKIFDKGYSGFNGQNSNQSTGIGLYLTKQILIRLNEEIEVNSEPRVGTEFKIYFPKNN